MRQITAVIQPHMLAPQMVDALGQAAHTVLPGDAIIGVCKALEVVRIRTGERGDDAV